MRKVKVKIIAEVTTVLELDDNENVYDRIVDIYSHRDGDYINKIDHGSDTCRIEVLDGN